MALSPINSDIEINLSKNRFTHDIGLLHDSYAIRQSLMNIILTIPGEKPFSQNFGTSINDSLFDNFSPMASGILEIELKDIIKLFEPRVEVYQIIINDSPITENTAYVSGHPIGLAKTHNNHDINLLYIYISYFLNNVSGHAPLRDSISIGLTKVR